MACRGPHTLNFEGPSAPQPPPHAKGLLLDHLGTGILLRSPQPPPRLSLPPAMGSTHVTSSRPHPSRTRRRSGPRPVMTTGPADSRGSPSTPGTPTLSRTRTPHRISKRAWHPVLLSEDQGFFGHQCSKPLPQHPLQQGDLLGPLLFALGLEGAISDGRSQAETDSPLDLTASRRWYGGPLTRSHSGLPCGFPERTGRQRPQIELHKMRVYPSQNPLPGHPSARSPCRMGAPL